jgi:hypothetical protein
MFSESKIMPKTVPFVEFLKAFSKFLHIGAKGILHVLHNFKYEFENSSVKPELAGEILGTSSRVLNIHLLGIFSLKQIMLTRVSGRESKLCGADLLPKNC